jgi:pimeloyl-ACP methyl ester carboxylesterase
MDLINRRHFSDLRGVLRLAVDATLGVTDLVENMHHTIQLRQAPLGASRAGNTRGVTGLVYKSIRGTTRLVGRGLDAGLAPLTAFLPESGSPAGRDALVSAVNGVYGDHLLQTNNPLAIEMSLRYQGQPLDFTNPDGQSRAAGQAPLTGKLLLFVHGLCLNDSHWTRDGHNHGEALAIKLGFTPLYLRYNTGLPIAINGQALADKLDSLLLEWPHPVSELAIVGHSMGGLVARSAYHHGREAGQDWLQHLRRMVFIGTPHHGAPLERGGKWIDYALDLSPYATPFTRIGKKRSAGINDLRHGSITSTPQQFVPLPTGVECYAMAASLAKKRSRVGDSLIGDGLVPVDSALGRSRDPARALLIPENRQWTGYETGHLALLGSKDVYRQLHDWLE